jgi:hypothetical protein
VVAHCRSDREDVERILAQAITSGLSVDLVKGQILAAYR